MCAMRLRGKRITLALPEQLEPTAEADDSGVPSWCADSRAIPAQTFSRSARSRVRNA